MTVFLSCLSVSQLLQLVIVNINNQLLTRYLFITLLLKYSIQHSGNYYIVQYIRGQLSAMNESAHQIAQKFKVQIRRRQRQDIMKRDRQKIINNEKIQRNRAQVKQPISNPVNCQFQGNAKAIYDQFLNQDKYFQLKSVDYLEKALQLLVQDQSLQQPNLIYMLSSYIQFCGSTSMHVKPKKLAIQAILNKSKIEQKIFKLIHKNVYNKDKKLKMLLCCLQNMAFMRLQSIRQKQLLEKYLLPLIQNLVSQPKILFFLGFVSQIHVFSPEVITMICNQSLSKQKFVKVAILTILHNYINLQESSQNIELLFERLLSTLLSLYLNNRQMGQKYSLLALQSINYLIAKFPDEHPEMLLAKISKTKLQDTISMILQISTLQYKQLGFQIQQTIIDKCIHSMKQAFFAHYSFQMICFLTMGLQINKESIQVKALKIILKLLKYADQESKHKIQQNNQLLYILEQLAYDKSQIVSSLAQILLNKFTNSNSQMIDM